jgi:hypothetical protein
MTRRKLIVLLFSFGAILVLESKAGSFTQSANVEVQALHLNLYVHDHAFDLKPPPKAPLLVPRPSPRDFLEPWRRRIAYGGGSLSLADGSP